MSEFPDLERCIKEICLPFTQERAHTQLASLIAERDELRTMVQDLVAALPRCSFDGCHATATMAHPTAEWGYFQKRCAAHPGAHTDDLNGDAFELRWAPIVRALQEKTWAHI